MRNAYKEHLRVERLHAGDLDVPMEQKAKVVSVEPGNDDKIAAQLTESGGSHD